MALRDCLFCTLGAAAVAITFAFAAPDAVAAKKPDAVTDLLVKRQYKRAVAKLKEQARAGSAQAQYRLGTLYRLGIGVPEDRGKAAFWYGKSAAQNYAKAARVMQRLAGTAPPTEKRLALRNGTPTENSSGPALEALPQRTVEGQGWLVLASVRGLSNVVKHLLERDDASAPKAYLASVRAGKTQTAALVANRGNLANVSGPRGETAAMLASRQSNEDLLVAVLATHPDLSARDVDGNDALASAAAACNFAAFRRLSEVIVKESIHPKWVNVFGGCPQADAFLPYVSSTNLALTDGDGRSSLWHAAYRNDTRVVSTLLSAGADPNAVDHIGLSPLHAAAAAGRPETLKLLLPIARRATPSPDNSLTPLMLAASSGCVACIDLLLDSGQELDAKDEFGNTALMFAVLSLQAEAAHHLMKAGANSNARDESGDTPAKLARRVGGPIERIIAQFSD